MNTNSDFLEWLFLKHGIDVDTEEQLYYNYKNNLRRRNKEYWIDPKGVVRKYNGDLSLAIISMHFMIAEKVHPKLVDPEIQLEQEGWIKVAACGYNAPIVSKPPTQKQIDTCFDLGIIDRLLVLDNGYYVKWNR